MKNIKAILLLAPVTLFIFACSKGNEHVSRDLYTLPIPLTFTIPINTEPINSKLITEFSNNINLDSLIKASAGNDFGVENIETIKLTAMRLDILNFDTIQNFRLIDSLQVRLRLGTDTTAILAQAISNPDINAETLNLPISATQPDLTHFFKSSGLLYRITGRIRRATDQPFDASLTARYQITIGR